MKFLKTGISRLPIHGFSIQKRLPLLICVLLLTVMLSFGLITYLTVKNIALKSGRERLQTFSTQLNDMLSQSAQTIVAITRGLATQKPIVDYLIDSNHYTTDETISALQKLKQDSSTIVVDVLDRNYKLLFRSDKKGIQYKINFDSLLTFTNAADTGSIGKFFAIKNTVYYPIVIGVTKKNALAGYIVRWRILSNNPRSVERLAELSGTKAKLYFGNADNTLWTNMVAQVPNPVPAGMLLADTVGEYTHDKNYQVMGSTRPIKNTSWLLLVEFSRQAVMEPAHRFLRWVIIAGSILIVVSIFIAWLMSRNLTRPLNKLTAAASSIASGSYTSPVEINRNDEVGKLALAFNEMMTQIRNAKLDLEQKIIEMRQMNDQLRNLSAHLQNIREEERIHIAREMHDELGQFLTGLKMDIGWLNKRLTAGKEKGASLEKLTEMSNLVNEAVSFVRKLASELRPSILDDLGLVAALEWHSQEFSRRFTIEVEFESHVENVDIPELIATGLFRMYQESLTNVARHSEATRVVARLLVGTEEIQLSIIDNGKGFVTSKVGTIKTLGLLGMQERAMMIGGQLEIISNPGKGTSIMIIVPLQQPAEKMQLLS